MEYRSRVATLAISSSDMSSEVTRNRETVPAIATAARALMYSFPMTERGHMSSSTTSVTMPKPSDARQTRFRPRMQYPDTNRMKPTPYTRIHTF